MVYSAKNIVYVLDGIFYSNSYRFLGILNKIEIQKLNSTAVQNVLKKLYQEKETFINNQLFQFSRSEITIMKFTQTIKKNINHKMYDDTLYIYSIY